MTSRSELFDIVDETFSESAARDLAVDMTQYYRAPGTSGYLTAMDIVESELRDAGLSVDTDSVAMEGAWEPRAASLSIVEPERASLVDFENAPGCLAWSSSPTDGFERLEIVDVGTGERATDFEDVDVEGKAVFVHGTRRRPGWWEAAKNAVEAGARGIVTDYMLYQTPGVREPELVPDATQLLRLRPAEFFEDEDVWAFSISHDASELLQSRLDEGGSVTVEANVEVDEFDGEIPYVDATIPGTERSDERVVLCGHASGIRPGANCAEGTGLVVELARTLADLVDRGVVEPRRSITFVLGAEGAVSSHFLETNPDATNDVIAALSYCSTGHDQAETDSCLMLSSSPDSVPHYLNDYLAELAAITPKEADWIGKESGKELPLLSYQQHYYTPWSDNTLFAAAGIPAPLFMSWPDRCFHSQHLTEDVIDPATLRRSALLSGVAALELATADDREATAIARIVAGRSVARIRSLGSEYATEQTTERARRHIQYVADRDAEAISRTAELTDADVDESLDRLTRHVAQAAEAEIAALTVSADESGSDGVGGLVPIRTVDDPIVDRWAGLGYEDLLAIADQLAAADDEAGWRSLRVVSDEAWNFVDGRRTVGEIADAVGFEFDLRIEPEPIHRILEGHAAADNLRFETP